MKKLLLILVIIMGLLVAVPMLFLRPDRAEASVSRTPPTCTVPAAASGSPAGNGTYAGVSLSPVQVDAVQKILGVAKGMSITVRGATIALQAAMQESTLDPQATNGNALGLFQQIAPGPGNVYVGYDRTDPEPAAKAFFTVLAKRAPSYDTDRRSNHELAEEVQRSGEGWRYERHQRFAEAVTAALYDGSGPPLSCVDKSVKGRIQVQVRGGAVTLPREAGVSGVIQAATPRIAAAVAAGLSWLGTTYAWGGGDANGPTRGVRDGGVADEHGDFNKIGFDCSGLTLYSYAQVGVRLTRPSSSQLTNAKVTVPFSQARPGDLLFWGTHHVAMYLGQMGGDHLILEAPQSGAVVKVSKVRTGGDFRDVAARPIPGG